MASTYHDAMTPCPQCGWNHHASQSITVTCAKCGASVHIAGGSDAVTTLRRLPLTSILSDLPQLKQQGRECWVALHTMEKPTAEKIRAWITTVPAIDCGCRKFARDYVRENPPPFEDLQNFRRWTYEFHCQVDAKTRDPIMAWEDACKHWGW